MATTVYIDGFNLYYGALRGTPYKWLNPMEMSQRLLPNRDINRVRYFTARSVSFAHDPQARSRQGSYLRALRTIPELTIHYGRFSAHPINAPRYPLTYYKPYATAGTGAYSEDGRETLRREPGDFAVG